MDRNDTSASEKAAHEGLSLRQVLKLALDEGASDVHLKVGRPPAIRVDGRLRFTEWSTITRDDMLGFLHDILGEERKERFLQSGDVDHAVSMPELGRFRVHCYRQRGLLTVVLRHVKAEIPGFEALNLPIKAMDRIASLSRGLVLITGPSSSGKSTTLAALIDRINETREGHIVTLEDPIEFIHVDKKCSVSQREIGIDTKDFKAGLGAVTREDPDVILVGEMRDTETFLTCMSAAEMGYLVFSTLHTTNVMMTFDRILDMFPSNEHEPVRSQLALQLRAIVSQRLLPAVGGKGRIPAVEVMFNNAGIALLIRGDEVEQIPNAIADGDEAGMQTFNMSLTSLVKRGLVDQQAAEWASDNPDELRMNLQGIFLSRGRGGITRR